MGPVMVTVVPGISVPSAALFNIISVSPKGITRLFEMVNVNITNTSLKNFLLAVSKVHNINISFSNEMVDPPIVNNFSNVKVIDLLVFLAKEYALEYDITGNIISVSNYEPPVEKYTPNPIKIADRIPMINSFNINISKPMPIKTAPIFAIGFQDLL